MASFNVPVWTVVPGCAAGDRDEGSLPMTLDGLRAL